MGYPLVAVVRTVVGTVVVVVVARKIQLIDVFFDFFCAFFFCVELSKKGELSKIPGFRVSHSWLVVWNIFIFSPILGMSSSQLTNSYIFERG